MKPAPAGSAEPQLGAKTPHAKLGLGTPSLPPGYKQTEVGVIPEEWECAQIASVAKLESGHTPSKRKPAYWGGKIPWVSLHDTGGLNGREILSTEQMITEEGLAHSSARMLPKGTVVFSRTATVGKTTVLGRNMATSQDFANYICGPRIDNYFLLYLFRGMGRTWKSLMAGSIHNTIYMPVFKALKIALPPLPEQRAIATALSDVDGLLGALDRLIAKKRDLKQAAMQQLLTGQTRLPGFNPGNAEPQLGEKKERAKLGLGAPGALPEGWQVKRLGDVASFYKGKGLPKSALTISGAEPCVHYGELFTRYTETIGEILSRTDITAGAFRSIANDVLMPTSDVTPRGLAKASCVKVNGVILGGDILVIRSDTKLINGSFLSYLIRYEDTQVLQLVTGSTVFHLYGSDMKKFTFLIPPLPEQTAIASVLSEMDAELAGLEQRREKTRALKQGMMQELLTGRTRLPGNAEPQLGASMKSK